MHSFPLNKKIIYYKNKPKLLRDIAAKTGFSYEEINSFYYFPSKRWDIKLKNNVVIKLSNTNINNVRINLF